MAEGEEKLPVYTWEQVEKHNTAQSLWLVVDGKVYDVTNFMEEHPGGEEVMLEVAGKDATEPFEDVGHSSDAREQQAKYLIGVVEGRTTKREDSETHISPDTTTANGSSSLSYIVPMLLILVIGVGVAYYLQY